MSVASLYRRHLSRGRAKLGEIAGGQLEVGSSGAWVHTSDGGRYLNAGGYGVFLHGARHPAVTAAVRAQLDRHPISTRLLLEPEAAYAAQALAEVAPGDLSQVYFASTGTEATEAAIKLARLNGRTHLVSTLDGYHGKTMGALSVTAKGVYQDPFEPLLPLRSHVPFGDADALAAVVTDRSCVFLEPIQGEAGVIIPPPGYLAEVARSCRAAGALLVFDEILTGLGRTGRWWAGDGVTPDMMLVGKTLSGGVVPVSAMIATPAVFAPFNRDPFLHTSTFSAAPITVAAARAAITAIAAEDLVGRAAALGARLLAGLRVIVAEQCRHLVREVRGAGLLLGIDFHGPGLAGELLVELLGQQVVVNHSLNNHTVVRLTPPAVLTDDDVEFLLTAVAKSCHALAARYPTRETTGSA